MDEVIIINRLIKPTKEKLLVILKKGKLDNHLGLKAKKKNQVESPLIA